MLRMEITPSEEDKAVSYHILLTLTEVCPFTVCVFSELEAS